MTQVMQIRKDYEHGFYETKDVRSSFREKERCLLFCFLFWHGGLLVDWPTGNQYKTFWFWNILYLENNFRQQ